MRKKIVIGVVGVAGFLLAAGVAPAMADDTVNSTVAGGDLTFTGSTGAIDLAAATLTGASQTVTGNSSGWTITDARGTGAAWTLSASATDFVSAAGGADATARTIVASNLKIDPSSIAAGTGADPVSGTDPATGLATTISASEETMSTSSAALITAGTNHKGKYTVTPKYSLNIPANAYRSNYKSGSSGDMNPYVSTITFTLN